MTTTLKQRWDELQRAHPMTRIRNAARMLGVSEVELLATRIGDGVTRLNNDHRGMLGQVHKLGRVMALTRNNDVVHERKGIYLNPTINPGPVGLFVGADASTFLLPSQREKVAEGRMRVPFVLRNNDLALGWCRPAHRDGGGEGEEREGE